MTEAAVTFLLESLKELLISEIQLVGDVKQKIENLNVELRSLQSMMADFKKSNYDSEFVDQTVKEVRVILDEAEDTIDTYILQASQQKLRGAVSKVVHQVTDYPQTREVCKQIQALTDKVKHINDARVDRGLKVLDHQYELSQRNKSKKQAPQVEEDNVIGFDKAAEKLGELLFKGVERLEIISIVGMLGLGKTTLAKKVYKEPNVDYQYMLKAFVYVAENCEKKDVLLSILYSISKGSKEVNDMNEEQLEKLLCNELKGKQYLIVLDDVWETSDWDKLRGAFPKNDRRCRVLITTRNEEVALHANRDRLSHYKLDFLNLADSRNLLRWRVFHTAEPEEIPENLVQYEIDIAKKCDGLPLAIVVIAGILMNDPYSPVYWGKVAYSVRDYIARDVKHAASVIELMYKHLPNYLKPCFLYLGVFREDAEIVVWKLIRLWISEGFIPQEGDINLEESAEMYLKELVQRNLVMVVKMRKNGRVKTCRMHDTLREFCKKEAEKNNIFQEIKANKQGEFPDVTSTISDTYRRICNNSIKISDYINEKLQGKHVRSFLSFMPDGKVTPASLDIKLVPCIPKAFNLLRVLEAQSLDLPIIPPIFCKLLLLKYVAISSSTIKVLPKGMSSLFNLQTLIVKNNFPIAIKADLWKMPQFRHLHTTASATLETPSTNKRSSNIQTLSMISPNNCTEELFVRAPKVKKLGIHGALVELLKGNNSFFQQLRRLEELEILKLINDEMGSELYSLPKDYPRRLTKLTLMDTRLDWKEMTVLGNLESLEILKLKKNSFVGPLWSTQKGGFQSLTHLFVGTADLVVWEASEDHFPKLKTLELNGCDQLDVFPHGLADIPSLQIVILHHTNATAVASAKEKFSNSNIKLSIFPQV